MILEEKYIDKTYEGMEGWAKTTCVIVEEPLPYGTDEVFAVSHSYNCTKDPHLLSELDVSLFNFIPSYKDVLSRTLLSIYAGGEPVSNKLEKTGKGENDKCDPVHTSVGEAAVLKGAVRGGLEKDFSPLKTRSARRLGIEKENCNCSSSLMMLVLGRLELKNPSPRLGNDCGFH
jgi:hypothetical protein